MPPCSKQIITNHAAGDEATEVTVTLSETCSGIAYPTNALRQNATQMLTKKVMQRFGTGYTLRGDIQVSILHTNITDQAHGIATLDVKLDATWVYQLSPGKRKQITRLIAGKSPQQAIKTLFQLPGIQGAAINSNIGVLPADPGRITIVVVNRSA